MDRVTNVICGWYQKRFDTGTLLKFRSYAPLHYKKKIKNSAWKKFDEAMKLKKKQLLDNQYPESWTDKFVAKTLDRLIKRKVNMSPSKDRGFIDNTDTPPMMVVRYRGNENSIFAKMLRNIIKAPIDLNTRTLKP